MIREGTSSASKALCMARAALLWPSPVKQLRIRILRSKVEPPLGPRQASAAGSAVACTSIT